MEKFDERFRESLLRITKGGRLPTDICQALKIDNSTRVIESETWRRLIYRSSSVTLITLCNFMRINPFAGLDTCTFNKKLTWMEIFRRLTRSSEKGTQKLWPYMVFALFNLAAWMGFFNLYHLYVYDANKARLHKLQELMSEPDSLERYGLSAADTARLRTEWRHKADEARAFLKTIGSSHLEWPFLSEGVLFMAIVSSFNNYITVPVIYRLSDMILPLPPGLFGDRSLGELRTRLIHDELNRYSLDCLSYARTRLEQMHRDLTRTFGDKDEPILDADMDRLRYKALAGLAVKLRRKHHETVGHLKAIALEGRLNSLTGTPACLDCFALTLFIGIIFLVLYMEIVLAWAYVKAHSFFEARGNRPEFNSVRDLFDVFNFILLLEICAISATCLLVTFVLMLAESITSVMRLRDLTLHVVRKNELRFRQLGHLAALDKADPTKLGLNFELDLMMLILHHRLAIRSVQLARGPLVMIACILLSFAIDTPIIFVVHTAYSGAEIKMITMVMGIASSALCITLLMPLGLLHTSGIKMYRELWSLAAQLSQCELNDGVNRCLKIDSSVAAFTLRRELADSLQTTDKFACKVLSIPITYGNLVKMAVWTFLALVTLTNDMSAYGEKLVRFMNDPFFLYSFMRPYKLG